MQQRNPEIDAEAASLRRCNAELIAERDEALAQSAALADVLQVINAASGDPAPVFDAILAHAMRLCEAAFGMLNSYDGETFHTAAVRGVPDEFAAFRRASPPAYGPGTPPARLIAGEPFVHVIDIKEDEPYRQGERNLRAIVELGGARTVLAVPLLRDARLAGMFAIYRQEVRPFTGRQIALLQNFAAQASLALQNSRLFNETREALERQTATADILKVIASSPSDVQPVFEAIATSANRLIGGFSTAVFRFIDGIAHLTAFTPTTPEADEVLRSRFPRPIMEYEPFELVRAGEPVQLADTETSAQLRDIARARGYRSMLFTPLVSGGAVIGVVSVTRKQTGSFAPHHVQLLRTFADQAVIAIQNAGLFNDTQEALQQQTATADVLKVISRSTFDLQTVLDTLTVSAANLCSADMAAMSRDDGTGFHHVTSHGFPPDWVDYNRTIKMQPGRGSVVGRALLEGAVVQVADVLADTEYTYLEPQKKAGYRTFLAVPLLREGQPIGMLSLANKGVRPFSPKQVELVETFADQAVIAIENARLFDEVQARTRELSQSLEDLRTAQDRLVQTEKLASLGQLTAGIAHEIKNPLNFVNNFAALSSELVDELKQTLAPSSLDDKTRGEVDELSQMLQDNLGKVVQHGRRADSIVRNMLLHSREGSGERRPADINALVEESLNLAWHGARAEKSGFDVTLARDLDPAAGALELYPQEITRVLLNLISNGFYAAIRRKAALGDGFEPKLSAATKNLGDRVEIRIRDNGAGISPEVKEKMFNPFFTTKPAGEGTGLGLSMSHDIVVKQHGGRIDVESVPDSFTEVVVTLPRGNAGAEAGEMAARGEGAAVKR